MKTNEELQRDVQNAIKREPLLHAAEIGVTVHDGVVTLTGTVDSYLKKTEAENATKRVFGVKALVEHIVVKFHSTWSKTDAEVADEVLVAFKTNYSVPDELLSVKVEKGWVTIDGEVPWNYQREAAKNALTYLSGVKGVKNDIKIKSDADDTVEKEEVEKAMSNSGAIDNGNINVLVKGSTVTLTGSVDSWYQKEEAGRIAWNTRGIWHVNNELEIEVEYAYS